MEKKNPESVGDVLRSMLEQTDLQHRMDELKAADLWPYITGPDIAAECSKPVVKNGLMTIGVKNASLRQEMHMNRSRIIEIINSHLGKEIITEIRFIS